MIAPLVIRLNIPPKKEKNARNKGIPLGVDRVLYKAKLRAGQKSLRGNIGVFRRKTIT
ncbi:hypothetical protein RB2150_01439 [Rhodobacteraceae bacterium HTCC2150]|nr:hypothetical protein RB2150_01439 [Rhodobacteraceae bacterium HTCC2150]